MSDPSSQGLTPLTLDYASPLTPTERLGDVDELIIANAPFKEYQRHFPSTKEAAIYYARFQMTRFSPAALDRVCTGCGCETDCAVNVRNVAAFPIKFTEFAISTAGYIVTFDTVHSMCAACLSATRRRMFNYGLGIAMRIVVVFLGIGYLMWSASSPPWAVALKERMDWGFYVPPMVLILGAVASVALKERQAANRLPVNLQGLVGATWKSVKQHQPESSRLNDRGY